VTLRPQATWAQVAAVSRPLAGVLALVAVTQPYPGRGATRLVRVHRKVPLDQAGLPSPARPANPNRPPHRAGRARPCGC
jgi:hypothetical protein